MCGKCEQAVFISSESRAGIGWSKVSHMMGTFVEMMRQDRHSHFHFSSSWPRVSEKNMPYILSDYLSDSSIRLHTGKVQNPERGGLYIFSAWFFACSELNYMTTESDQLWKPDKTVWGCER